MFRRGSTEKSSMTGSLAKYVSRSPRYILQTEDNTLIRLAGPNQVPWEEGTEIQNISLSGLGFTAPADLSPVIGEVIRVQFEVPNASQMACFALVSRLERRSSSTVFVGVQFMKLDLPQRLYLTHSLSLKLREQQRREARQRSQMNWHLKAPRLFLAWFFLGIWIMALWMWMSGFLHKIGEIF